MEFLQSVGILDIVFIVILAVSILLGLIRGAVREVLSLVGLAVSIYLAFKFSDTLSNDYVSKFFEEEKISYIISFVLIIVGTIFVIALFNLLISQLLKASGLSLLDRFLGFLFGALRGTVLCSILVVIIGFVPGVEKEKWWTESTLAPIFKTVVAKAMVYVPNNVQKYIAPTKETSPASNNATNQAGDKDGLGQSVRPQSTGDVTKHVLKPIDTSFRKTTQPKIEIELESASPQEDDATRNANEDKKAELVLESYQ